MIGFSHKPQGVAQTKGNKMLDFISALVENIQTTISGLIVAIFNPNYSLGEWVYDTVDSWTTW